MGILDTALDAGRSTLAKARDVAGAATDMATEKAGAIKDRFDGANSFGEELDEIVKKWVNKGTRVSEIANTLTQKAASL